MKKIFVRLVIVVVILMVVGLAVVFFSLNSIVKKGVETVGPMMTKVEVKLGSADISPFSGGGKLSKLFVGNPEGYKSPSAIQVGDIKVSVSVDSVLSDTIVVNEVNVQAAEITLEGSLSGNNLTTIMDNLNGASATATEPKPKGAATSPPGTSKSSKKFIVKDFVIEGAKVNLNVTLPGLGNKIMTVPVPAVHLQNIGTAENGVTAEQLGQTIMKPLLASVTKAATDALVNSAGQLKDLGKGTSPEINKAAKGITDLFNRK